MPSGDPLVLFMDTPKKKIYKGWEKSILQKWEGVEVEIIQIYLLGGGGDLAYFMSVIWNQYGPPRGFLIFVGIDNYDMEIYVVLCSFFGWILFFNVSVNGWSGEGSVRLCVTWTEYQADYLLYDSYFIKACRDLWDLKVEYLK